MFSIYSPLTQNINLFLDRLSEGPDFYSKHENIWKLGGFNVIPSKFNQNLELLFTQEK